jgi:hypothetical protein
MHIDLPAADRSLQRFTLSAPRTFAHGPHLRSRIAYSAAHVVADPWAARDPWVRSPIDWDATIAYRRYLWSLGLGVAEAMDTAQRGMGLDWPTSLDLIRRSVDASHEFPGAQLASGAGTDHLADGMPHDIDAVIAAYAEQCEAIEKCGGRIILMASRALAAVARGPDDYHRVYGRILSQLREPAILHWLGDMFDPALRNYWGHADLDAASDVCLAVIEANLDKVDGVKISLLDESKEVALRRRLPAACRMYTGDDFNYPALIAGDGTHHSDALLGIFDAIAPAAAAALACLDAEDVAAFHDILAPTLPLSRHIFQAPTRFYKTGVVFLAYLNGHQDHFTMVGGQESARGLLHLAETFRLADRAGLLRSPDLALTRMQAVLVTHGIG